MTTESDEALERRILFEGGVCQGLDLAEQITALLRSAPPQVAGIALAEASAVHFSRYRDARVCRAMIHTWTRMFRDLLGLASAAQTVVDNSEA